MTNEKTITVAIPARGGEPQEVVIQDGSTASDIRSELRLDPTFKVVRMDGQQVSDNADLYATLTDKEKIRMASEANLGI